MRISDWSSDVCSSDLLVRRYRRKDRTDFFQLIIENWPQCDRPNNTPKEARYTAAEWNEMSESRDLFDALPTGEGNSPVTEKIEKGRANLIPEGVNLTASTGEGDSPNTLEEPLEEPLEESGVDVEISQIGRASGRERVCKTVEN